MATGEMSLPEGFVIDKKEAPKSGLPEGFVPDKQVGPMSEQVRARIAGGAGRRVSAKVAAELRQLDPDVDYAGIANPDVRLGYSFQDTPEEKTAYLESIYGKGKVVKDSYGRDVIVRPDGKRVSFLPRAGKETGKEGAALSSWSDISGELLPTAGMVMGGVTGGMTTPAFPPAGAVVGSGAGAAAGRAGNKLIKQGMGAFGLGGNRQSSEETARDIVLEVPKGMAAEGVTRVLNLIGRSALGPFKEDSIFGPWTQASKERFRQRQEDVKLARDIGLKPKLGTVSPAAGLTQRVQNAGFRLFGDETTAKNRPIIEAKAEALFGSPPTEMPQQAVERVNLAIARRVDDEMTRLETEARTAITSANNALERSEQDIARQIGPASPTLARDISTTVDKAKDEFQERATRLYGPVDAMVGQPVVPNDGIKKVMAQILSEGPKKITGEPALASDTIKKFAKDISEMGAYSTFQEMQIMRATFRDRSSLEALNAGLSEGQAKRLWIAANQAFSDAEASLMARAGTGVLDSSGKEITRDVPVEGVKAAVKALRRADRFYAAGMKRFGDLAVEALYKDATERGFVQPDKVAQFIAQPGMEKRFNRIAKVLSPELISQVAAERWQQMLTASSDNMTGRISGKKLAKQLSDMGGMVDRLYGPVTARGLREHANRLAALDGDLDVKALLPSNATDAIREAVAQQEITNTTMKRRFMAALQTEGQESMRAVRWLTEPDNRLYLRQTLEQFGTDSQESKGIKEYLARKLLSTMEVPATRGAERYASSEGTELMGQPLVKSLNSYGRPYLEEVFGKPWTDEAFKFAKTVEIGTRKNPIDSGGLLAAGVGAHWVHNFRDLARFFLGGELLQSELMMTYLSRGVENEGVNFLAKWLGGLTRAGVAYESESIPKEEAENVRAFTTHYRKQIPRSASALPSSFNSMLRNVP